MMEEHEANIEKDPICKIPLLDNIEPQHFSNFEETSKCLHENHTEYQKTFRFINILFLFFYLLIFS